MGNVGAVSYALGAVAFGALALLLATRWRTRFPGGSAALVAASFSAAWSGVLAAEASGAVSLPIQVLYSIEILRDAAWLVFLLVMLGKTGSAVSVGLRIAVHALWSGALVLGVVAGTLARQQTDASGYATAFILGPFLASVMGLVLVEQLYRNTSLDGRWGIKHLCLGVGGIFAYDLFLFSNGLLFRQLEVDLWNARGAVGALLVPLIGLAAIRLREGPTEIHISRQMVFYTTSLLGAGVYLLAMAAGGYYIRIYGGDWGRVVQIIFLFGAVVLLLVLLFSGQMRARIKVFVSKHFFNYKYDYRDEWLRLIATISSPDDERPLRDRAIVALSQIVESPGGALWTHAEGIGYRAASQWNIRVPEQADCLANAALVKFLTERQWVVDLGELKESPAVYGDLELPAWFASIRNAWLIVPLILDDRLFGFAVLAEPRARQKLTWEDLDILKTAGRQVAGFLAQHEAAQQLTEGRQFQAFNQLTAFIMHDLNNLIAQQSLVVKNAARHKDNPAFIEDAIATVDNSVQRMSRLLEQLRRGGQAGAPRRVELDALLEGVVESCSRREPAPGLEIVDPGLHVHVGRERLAMVLGHVVRNAQDATGAGGKVTVRLRRSGSDVLIDVVDTGTGMDAAFVRDRLFRPFDSTKGSRGMGIGAYQTREFIRSAGGDVVVNSAPGEGTTFTLRLPALDDAASAGEPLKTAGVQK